MAGKDESWVINHPEMMSYSVNSLRAILKQAGLKMEIRVWREEPKPKEEED